MPDRFSPEYIALAREMRLPREWQEGDHYLHADYVRAGPLIHMREAGKFAPDDDRAVWLPLADDILDLLEAEGWPNATLCRWGNGFKAECWTDDLTGDVWSSPESPDRLTALLRLLKRVMEEKT